MNLSTLLGSTVKPYLEYGWVCAPNTAGQSIAANTITTLTIDTEVADTGNFGSIASNQITLAAGTYYYKAYTMLAYNGSYPNGSIISLYNVSDSLYVTRRGAGLQTMTEINIDGQFTITATKVFQLQIATVSGGSVAGNYFGGGTFSLATAGADQRTTLKLWKLA